MKLTCSICNTEISSVLIDKQHAAIDVAQKLMEHYQRGTGILAEGHQKMLREVMSKAMLLGTVVNWIILVKGCTKEPLETRVETQMKDQEEVIAKELQLGKALDFDDKCRKCGKEGYKLDEFTSPYSGLCVDCTEEKTIDKAKPTSVS